MKINNVVVEPRALLGELVGTFVLALIAITTGNVIIVGFTMLVLALVLGKATGAHVNPAVTFGLWSIKKFETVLVPFYWAAQMAGGLLALALMSFFSDKGFSLSLASFNNLDPKIFMAELIGTAVFVFTVTAAVQGGLKNAARSLAIGFGLLAGLAAGTGLIGVAMQSPELADSKTTPRIAKISSITANPAVAIASSEKAEQSITTNANEKPKTTPSQLSGEVILGTLIGGVFGANMFMLIAGVNPFDTTNTKVKAVVKTKEKVSKKKK